MAMITCRECKASISSEAATCPQCGCPEPERTIQAKEPTKKSRFLRAQLTVILQCNNSHCAATFPC